MYIALSNAMFSSPELSVSANIRMAHARCYGEMSRIREGVLVI